MTTTELDFLLAKNLKLTLNSKKIKVKELSLRSQVPLKTIYGWLAGNKPRSIEDLKKVALALNISLDNLAFGAISEVIPQDVSKACQDLLARILVHLLKHSEDLEVYIIKTPTKTIFSMALHPEDRALMLGTKMEVIESLNRVIKAICARRGINGEIRIHSSP